MGLGIGLGIGVDRRGQTGDVTAPTITSASSANCAENAQLAHALTANETVTWTITGGVDAGRFEISGSTLRWAGNGTKNFEAPDDFNANNTYLVQVTATDEALNATAQNISITVTNILEVTLAALSLDDLTIAEDQPTGTKVGTITGATSGSTVTLHAQSNANMFAKDGNDIEVGATPLDFETVPSPTITLRETHADASNSPRDSVIGITVTDVSEGPSLGPELVTNGDFASGAGWNANEGYWSVAGGKGVLNSPDFGDALFRDDLTLEATPHRVSYTIDSISTGTITVVLGSAVGIARIAAGAYTEDLTPTGGDFDIQLQAGGLAVGGTAQIDNVSVKEIL